MKATTLTLVISLFALAFSVKLVADENNAPIHEIITAGWLEEILLQPWNIKLRAKLDTGAKTSSLHAVDIERFDRDGTHWVKFRTIASSNKNELMPMEAPLVRDVKIKDHKRKSSTRPVVEMTFCLADQIYTSEFSLVDRSKFNYPVLLGRLMLQQGIIVDPALTFTFRSNKKMCEKLINTDK